ncbi:MAG: hypothetical protein GX663_10875 [Clostridiales bacterium]|nr:hypothetical protein [Clostridiales bacterium]
MAEQQYDAAAIEAGVQSLSDVQLLTLHHQIQNADGGDYNANLVTAVEQRANRILDADAQLATLEDGTSINATDFFYGNLAEESSTNADEYNTSINDALNTVANNSKQAQEDLNWYRENYAEAQNKFQEAAATFAKETGTTEISFEQAANQSEGTPDWVKSFQEDLKDQYGQDDSGEVDTSNMSDESIEAYKTMVAITDEMAIHSTVGSDRAIQNAGMKKYDDKTVTSYRGSGTGGEVDNLEGIGESDSGSGIGKGGNGTGNGSGSGEGDGDGLEEQLSKAKSSKSGDVDVDSVFLKNPINDNTADDIAAYMTAMASEPQINHIFSNTHYGVNAVPEWSFSVDFIPCTKTVTSFVNLTELKLLTKAIQTVTANEKTVNIQKLNYLGLSHPFFTKMSQTHGDLNVTFAENEEYQVTRLLVKLLKYGSFVPSFPTYEIVDVVDTNEMRKAILNDTELIMTHAPSDDESPAYKLNAAVLNKDTAGEIPDGEFNKLSKTNKYLFDIVLKLYKPSDAHAFGDNKRNHPQYIYHYHKCWIKNIGSIELNYNDDTQIDREVVFSYQYLTTSTYDEYLAKYLSQPREASQEEMINYVENINDLHELPDLDEEFADNTTMNRSPAPMSEGAARDFVETYTPKAQPNRMNGYSDYLNRKATTRGY